MDESSTKRDWLEEALIRAATPKHMQKETVDEFCAKYDIARNTYYYHVTKEENQKKILGMVLTKAKEDAPDILDILVQKAKDGDMKAIETYLDSILRLVKQFDITSNDKPVPLLHVLHNDSNKENSEVKQEG